MWTERWWMRGAILTLALNGVFLGWVVAPLVTSQWKGDRHIGWLCGGCAMASIFALLPISGAVFSRMGALWRWEGHGPWIKSLAVLLLIVSFGGSGFWLGTTSDQMRYQKRRDASRKARFMDQGAPNIRSTTLNGKPWKLEDFRGKVVLLDFWATWCGPCIQAVPFLKGLHARYGQRPDFEIVSISLDTEPERLKAFVSELDIPWTQVFEPGDGWSKKIVSAFEVDAIPSFWILDREGTVRAVNLHSDNEAERVLDSCLGPVSIPPSPASFSQPAPSFGAQGVSHGASATAQMSPRS